MPRSADVDSLEKLLLENGRFDLHVREERDALVVYSEREGGDPLVHVKLVRAGEGYEAAFFEDGRWRMPGVRGTIAEIVDQLASGGAGPGA